MRSVGDILLDSDIAVNVFTWTVTTIYTDLENQENRKQSILRKLKAF